MPANDSSAAAEQIEVYAVADGPRASSARARPSSDSLAASISSFERPDVAGEGPQRHRHAHRGVRRHRARASRSARWSPCASRDGSDWVLGVVRRVEQGLATRGRGRRVDHRRAPRSPSCCTRSARRGRIMGIVVDGIDVSTIGERFDGLYLPPPSRPDKPLAAKTLIVPTSEYADGRHVILITAPHGVHGRAARAARAASPTGLGRDRDRREDGARPRRRGLRLVRSRCRSDRALIARPELERQRALPQIRADRAAAAATTCGSRARRRRRRRARRSTSRSVTSMISPVGSCTTSNIASGLPANVAAARSRCP